MHPDHRGLALLLSLGSLPLAFGCEKNEPSDTDTNTAPTTDPGTDPPATDPSTTPPATDPPATDPSGTTDGPTTGPSTMSTDPDPTDTADPPGTPCAAYADKIVECFPDTRPYASYYVMYCETFLSDGLELDGPQCVAAWEAYYACFNALACADLESEQCAPESEAVDAACPNSTGSGMSTGTDSSGTETGDSSG